MTRRLLPVALLVLIACGPSAQAAWAKGIEMTGAPQGATVPGSPYRYVAIAPNATPKLTVVERIDRRGGRVDRWWYLRGRYNVPAVAYDGTAGGLSADGRTLVLSRFTWGYPPKTTRLAILDTDLHLRHPRRAGQPRPRHAISYVDLRGHFSFDAISPNGSTIYLIHYFRRQSGPAYLDNYEVRALDVRSRRLLPEPIVDLSEPDERMEGLPLTRASSPDGRWAYTLYDGNGKEPFLHALDTVGGRAVCVDLPWLEDLNRRFFYLLQLQMSHGGGELTVIRRRPGPKASRPLLTVDTRSFEVRRPAPVATASSGVGPWLPLGAAAAALALAVAWITSKGRRKAGSAERLEST